MSPGDKDRAAAVADFTSKAAAALRRGVHVLVIDPLPPGKHDPGGLAGAVVEELHVGGTDDEADEPCPAVVRGPLDESLGFTSFEAGAVVNIFVEPRAVGAELPTMPLFLAAGRYVNVPLGESYARAWAETPRFWRDALDPPG